MKIFFDFHISKLKNLKVIYGLYFQCLTQTEYTGHHRTPMESRCYSLCRSLSPTQQCKIELN